jgi:hypothetical protein
MDSSMRLEDKSVLTSRIDLYRSSFVLMYKACCVSRGFSYQEGEDYDETLTPVIEEIVPIFMKTTKTTMIHI